MFCYALLCFAMFGPQTQMVQTHRVQKASLPALQTVCLPLSLSFCLSCMHSRRRAYIAKIAQKKEYKGI